VIHRTSAGRLALATRAEVQVVHRGVDANSAGIANGFIQQILRRFRAGAGAIAASAPVRNPGEFSLQPPALPSSCSLCRGGSAIVLTLIATLVSAVTLVREKDPGTLEAAA